MQYKKIMILTIILTCLLTISAVSAADNLTNSVISADDASEDVVSVDKTNVVNYNCELINQDSSVEIGPVDINDGKEVLSSSEENVVSSVEDEDILSADDLSVAVYHTSMQFGENKDIKIFIMPGKSNSYNFDLKFFNKDTNELVFTVNFEGTKSSSFDKYYTLPNDIFQPGTYVMKAIRKSDGYLMDNAYLEVNAMSANYYSVNVQDTKMYYATGGDICMVIKPPAFRSNCKYDFHVEIRDSSENLVLKSNRMYSFKPDTSAKFKIKPATLKPGNYVIIIVNTGSGVMDYATLKVLPGKATPKLVVAKKTFKKSIKTKKYTISLKDNNNKVMKNTKVTLKINKKTYTAKTNSKGKATFKIKKLTKKGKYNVVVTYKGNKYYNKVTKKTKIIVK